MKLQTLCFEGDYTLEKIEKEKSNYYYANGIGVRKKCAAGRHVVCQSCRTGA